MLPRTVIYDPELTLTLPVALSVTSGMNAIAHAAEAIRATEAVSRIQRALGIAGHTSAAAALFDLARDNGAPVALRDIGMKEADLDRAAEVAVSNPY